MRLQRQGGKGRLVSDKAVLCRRRHQRARLLHAEKRIDTRAGRGSDPVRQNRPASQRGDHRRIRRRPHEKQIRLRGGEARSAHRQLKGKGHLPAEGAHRRSFPDEDDIVFFEIALSGRSTMDAYLVTGNLKHYPVRSYVVTPRQMLEIIEGDPD